MATVTLSYVDQVIATTEKAVLVRFTHGQETWIPRTACDSGDELAKATPTSLSAAGLLPGRG
jgi:hypothetical protein